MIRDSFNNTLSQMQFNESIQADKDRQVVEGVTILSAEPNSFMQPYRKIDHQANKVLSTSCAQKDSMKEKLEQSDISVKSIKDVLHEIALMDEKNAALDAQRKEKKASINAKKREKKKAKKESRISSVQATQDKGVVINTSQKIQKKIDDEKVLSSIRNKTHAHPSHLGKDSTSQIVKTSENIDKAASVVFMDLDSEEEIEHVFEYEKSYDGKSEYQQESSREYADLVEIVRNPQHLVTKAEAFYSKAREMNVHSRITDWVRYKPQILEFKNSYRQMNDIEKVHAKMLHTVDFEVVRFIRTIMQPELKRSTRSSKPEELYTYPGYILSYRGVPQVFTGTFEHCYTDKGMLYHHYFKPQSVTAIHAKDIETFKNVGRQDPIRTDVEDRYIVWENQEYWIIDNKRKKIKYILPRDPMIMQ